MTTRRLLISFSGGETSALMTKLILENMRDEYDDIRVVFANTGQENEETLEFVDACDKAFGFETIWLEAVTPFERGVGVQHRVVDFETASRSGEPFEEMIIKHGIPNQAMPLCSTRLKSYPIKHYARSIGWKSSSYDLAIGIRTDEGDRMSPNAKKSRIIYPMISRLPHTKAMVNEFWQAQMFRLNLKGYQGNCKWCWKKSLRKHLTIITENPSAYDFPERMEAEYPLNGPSKTGEPKKFFRDNISTKQLRELALTKKFTPATDDARQYQIDLMDWLSTNGTLDPDMDLDACGSESCEVDFAVG